MNHTIFSQEYFRPPEDTYAAFEITPTIGQKRVFVMALRGGALTTAGPVYGPRPYAVGRNLVYPRWPEKVLSEEERVAGNPDGDLYWLRPVGRAVPNTDGRICEVVGRELRPLGRVIRGPQGQLFELLPVSAQTTADSDASNIVDGELINETKHPETLDQEKTAAQQKRTQHQTAGGDRSRCRRLFADPGLPRVVELGKFRRALAPQLAHPERLRDLHRLACYVQVYEALAHQRADEFLEAIQCAGHPNIPIEPLTQESIAILGLQEFVQRHLCLPKGPLREPGYVLPFECFYSVRVGSDPTAETVEATKTGISEGRNARSECTPVAPAQANSSQGKAPSSCRGIPERFQNPWEFQFSRDEVLYDMNAAAASWGYAGALLQRVQRWFRARAEFRRWRALLGAKDLEEQLWAVRPPHGSGCDPSVREWARQTLDSAGYDSRVMLREWEIFWRRKGV